MYRKYSSLKKIALVTLALGALSQPALAATINIDKCQTISTPGVYKLVKDVALSTPPPNPFGCIVIKADNVTLDLGGHTHRVAVEMALLNS